jgi:two-component system sensor histidine kinase SenX3
VSHELQTPITAMRIAVESLLRSDRPPDNYREVAADVLLDLERLTALIRDLRLLALAGAGKLVAPVETFDVAEVVAECCDIARAIGEEKGIRVEQDVQQGLLVMGNPLHLRRAVLNLTDNAVRYSPAGAVIKVRLSRSRAGARVDVTDHGCGIAEADRGRIFEPFFRTDPARARETGGSGLGLAIADQIVRAHGGHIAVTSVPDAGSTFTIHLPARAAAPAPAA